MIEVADAAFYYDETQPLFRDVTLNVKKGETLAVLGVNGAGKTTFIKCLMGFLKLKSGYVRIDGARADAQGPSAFWKRVSYVPQAKYATFGFSVTDMVVMGLSPYIALGSAPKKEDYNKAREMLGSLGLSAIADKPCTKISGGQLQMVLIARALIKKPQVLIMDEPESNLDMKNQMKVLEIIKWLNRQHLSIIINTHFPAHALRVASQSLIIGNNEHIAGPTEHIVNEANLEKFFGVQSEIIRSGHKDGGAWGVVPFELADPLKLEDLKL
ncbi:ABC transporter ATP-binding protein [Paenibacillus thalictri]|uniref:ABC transporter ATP-binding protein n=1 Tax=Paenibacillus thalictri TaxID=2527873 RepID=UPI0013EF5395|nr:ABC transporter ATP-binding protein [Paenibacillus thalictri]